MNNLASVAGRFGLSLIFILSGFAKLGAGYASLDELDAALFQAMRKHAPA